VVNAQFVELCIDAFQQSLSCRHTLGRRGDNNCVATFQRVDVGRRRAGIGSGDNHTNHTIRACNFSDACVCIVPDYTVGRGVLNVVHHAQRSR
jgi:hypothetical protein